MFKTREAIAIPFLVIGCFFLGLGIIIGFGFRVYKEFTQKMKYVF